MDTVPWVAVIVTAVLAVGLVGLNVNVPVLAPAATVTDAATGAIVVFELFRVTVNPDGPAGPVSVTVPVTTFVLFP